MDVLRNGSAVALEPLDSPGWSAYVVLIGVLAVVGGVTSIEPLRSWLGRDLRELLTTAIAILGGTTTVIMLCVELGWQPTAIAATALVCIEIVLATALAVSLARSYRRKGKVAVTLIATAISVVIAIITPSWPSFFAWALAAVICVVLLPANLIRSSRPPRHRFAAIHIGIGLLALWIVGCGALAAAGVSPPWQFLILSQTTLYLFWVVGIIAPIQARRRVSSPRHVSQHETFLI